MRNRKLKIQRKKQNKYLSIKAIWYNSKKLIHHTHKCCDHLLLIVVQMFITSSAATKIV